MDLVAHCERLDRALTQRNIECEQLREIVALEQDARAKASADFRDAEAKLKGAVKVPSDGEPGFDAIVDMLVGRFHFPASHAFRVTEAVLNTLRGR